MNSALRPARARLFRADNPSSSFSFSFSSSKTTAKIEDEDENEDEDERLPQWKDAPCRPAVSGSLGTGV